MANPVGVGAGFPDVGDRSAKLAAQFDHVRRRVVQVSVGNGAAGVLEYAPPDGIPEHVECLHDEQSIRVRTYMSYLIHESPRVRHNACQ